MANSTPFQNGSERHDSLTPRGSISVIVTVINESTSYNSIRSKNPSISSDIKPSLEICRRQ